jgi:hypothetical protein
MNPESFYRGALAAAYERFPPYPQGRCRGRGIVLCAGGVVHLANAYICMKFLREFTSLPIELFFAGEAEMPREVRELLRRDFAPITLTDITNPELQATYPFQPVLHRSSRHRHGAGRSDRDRRTDPRLRAGDGGDRLCRHR